MGGGGGIGVACLVSPARGEEKATSSLEEDHEAAQPCPVASQIKIILTKMTICMVIGRLLYHNATLILKCSITKKSKMPIFYFLLCCTAQAAHSSCLVHLIFAPNLARAAADGRYHSNTDVPCSHPPFGTPAYKFRGTLDSDREDRATCGEVTIPISL